MTTEQLKELEEKAKLWDELSHVLHKLLNPIKQDKSVVFDYKRLATTLEPSLTTGSDNYHSATTIENTSNASTFLDVLKEEFNEGLCSCGDKKFGHFSKCQSCLDIYSGHSGNGNF